MLYKAIIASASPLTNISIMDGGAAAMSLAKQNLEITAQNYNNKLNIAWISIVWLIILIGLFLVSVLDQKTNSKLITYICNLIGCIGTILIAIWVYRILQERETLVNMANLGDMSMQNTYRNTINNIIKDKDVLTTFMQNTSNSNSNFINNMKSLLSFLSQVPNIHANLDDAIKFFITISKIAKDHNFTTLVNNIGYNNIINIINIISSNNISLAQLDALINSINNIFTIQDAFSILPILNSPNIMNNLDYYISILDTLNTYNIKFNSIDDILAMLQYINTPIVINNQSFTLKELLSISKQVTEEYMTDSDKLILQLTNNISANDFNIIKQIFQATANSKKMTNLQLLTFRRLRPISSSRYFAENLTYEPGYWYPMDGIYTGSNGNPVFAYYWETASWNVDDTWLYYTNLISLINTQNTININGKINLTYEHGWPCAHPHWLYKYVYQRYEMDYPNNNTFNNVGTYYNYDVAFNILDNGGNNNISPGIFMHTYIFSLLLSKLNLIKTEFNITNNQQALQLLQEMIYVGTYSPTDINTLSTFITTKPNTILSMITNTNLPVTLNNITLYNQYRNLYILNGVKMLAQVL